METKLIPSLNTIQKSNLELATKVLKENFTNPDVIAGILAIVGKESRFIPKEESSYRNTSNDRIRAIFSKRVSDLSDAQLDALKKDDKAFFEKVYGANSGAPLGNKLPGDGYKYRGRGFNQLTGRANYDFYGKKIGVDLVNNPDLLKDPEIAAKQLAMFFRIQFANVTNRLKEYGVTDVNDFRNLNDTVTATFHANAGWGKSKQQIEGDPTGGLAKARAYAPEFLEYIGGEKKNLTSFKMVFIALLLMIAIWFFFLRR